MTGHWPALGTPAVPFPGLASVLVPDFILQVCEITNSDSKPTFCSQWDSDSLWVGGQVKCRESGVLEAGMEVLRFFPHTLPYACLPSSCSWVISFCSKTVICLVKYFWVLGAALVNELTQRGSMRKHSKVCEDLERMGNNLDLGLVSEVGVGRSSLIGLSLWNLMLSPGR